MRKYTKYLLMAVATLLLCCDCTTRIPSSFTERDNLITHATLLQMYETSEGYTVCQIMNPWRENEVMASYLLVPKSDKSFKGSSIEEQIRLHGLADNTTVLRTPLDNMTVTTSCHTWLLLQLDAMQHISALCDTAYITSHDVKNYLQQHPEIADAGQSNLPNTEVILKEQSDAIWISPFENADLSTLQHLPTALIYCADYMENSPLSRAEWMRFFGRLVGKGNEADALFTDIQVRYDSLRQIAQDKHSENNKPLLLAEFPYGATWYVPGGNSTTAHLYQDAGYNYPWADDPHAGSLSLSPEAVLAKALDCDRWLIKYMDETTDWTLTQFLAQNPYYAQFKAAQTGEVWGCNTSRSDIFDVTPFRPDLLLESLINDDYRYFKRLEK